MLGASDDRDRDRGWYGGDWDYATSSYRDVAMYSIGLIFFVGAFFLPVGEDEPIWAYLGLGGFAFLAAIQLYLAIMFRFRWNDHGVELTHRMTRPVFMAWPDIRWARYIGTLGILVFSGPGRPLAFIGRGRSDAILFYDDLSKNIGDRLHSRWPEFDDILMIYCRNSTTIRSPTTSPDCGTLSCGRYGRLVFPGGRIADCPLAIPADSRYPAPC